METTSGKVGRALGGSLGRAMVLAGAVAIGAGGGEARAQKEEPKKPAWAQDDALKGARTTLAPEQIKAGMKGYGLSVFHGVKPEAFAVEVVSVQQDFSPEHGVVWVRCTEERMQKSGPVQGMSGSPIYLWGEGEAAELGKGGKLVGAFAFGFATGKDCFVGVQPVGYMREVGSRVNGEVNAGKKIADAGATVDGGQSSQGAETLSRLVAAYRKRDGMPDQGYVARTIAAALSGKAKGVEAEPAQVVPRELGNEGGRVMPLMLPMRFSTPAIASAMRPMFEPMGISPMAGGAGAPGGVAGAGMVAGKPPDGIDPEAVKFEPGSAITIPLAWGSMDMCALGTVTDVLPDGRVLAFGHAMTGQGSATFPMSTGYVHFVQPSSNISFKIGGSAAIRGTILRDEKSAIAGAPVTAFASSPLTVTVNMPNQKPAVFKYQVTNNRAMMPAIVVGATLESISATQNIPAENTVRLRGVMKFEGNRNIEIDTLLMHEPAKEDKPDPIVMNLLPILSALMQNQHQSLMLQEMTLTADVMPEVKVATLGNARLDRARCAPGEKIGMTIRVHPFGKPAFDKRIELPVPDATPEGDYMLAICDPSSYLQTLIMSKPHILATTNIDELVALVKKVMAVKSDGIYAVLFLEQEGVVVGHREMPLLPSSKRALLAAPAVTNVTPFTETIEKSVTTGVMCSGNQMFTLSVRKNR